MDTNTQSLWFTTKNQFLQQTGMFNILLYTHLYTLMIKQQNTKSHCTFGEERVKLGAGWFSGCDLKPQQQFCIQQKRSLGFNVTTCEISTL